MSNEALKAMADAMAGSMAMAKRAAREAAAREWQACGDPATMLNRLLHHVRSPFAEAGMPKPSDRKLRLFACACCRQVWHLLADDRSRKAVDAAEKYADGLATEKEFLAASMEATLARQQSPFCPWNEQTPDQERDMAALAVCNLFQEHARNAASEALRLCGSKTLRPTLAALLREIVGDPFNPVRCSATGNPLGTDTVLLRGDGTLAGCDCRWLTPDVLAVANAIYAEGRWGDLPVLADALEEAGCPAEATEEATATGGHGCPQCGGPAPYRQGVGFENERLCRKCWLSWEPGRDVAFVRSRANPLLEHLRSAGPHVRGCWALDCVLGRN